MKGLLVALVCVGALLTLSVAPVLANDVGGSFVVTADEPTVITVSDGDTLTPLTEVTATVIVTSPGALTGMTFKVYYDASGASTDGTEFTNAGTGNTQTCYVITWDGSTFSGSPNSSTTWVLGTCSYTAGTGTFSLKFTPGKVATATTGDAKWQMGATATNATGPSTPAFSSTPASMNLRTEIKAIPTSFAWGTVPAGIDYGDGTASQEALGTVTVIANGSYGMDVSTSSLTWGTATMVTDTPDATQEFAVRFDDDATVAGATQLSTTPQEVLAGGLSAEAGNDHTAINFWLKLSSIFTAATYNGTIVIVVG